MQKILVLIFACLTITGCKEKDDNDNYLDAPSELDKTKLLELVNEAREAGCNCGDTYYQPVSALSWNDKVEQAAQIHSDDMYNNSSFSHTGSDGSSAGDRLTRVGYNWNLWAENIANGYPNEEAVINGWLNSPGHCKNIMNPDVVHMGVAVRGSYWTQVFGRESHY